MTSSGLKVKSSGVARVGSIHGNRTRSTRADRAPDTEPLIRAVLVMRS